MLTKKLHGSAQPSGGRPRAEYLGDRDQPIRDDVEEPTHTRSSSVRPEEPVEETRGAADDTEEATHTPARNVRPEEPVGEIPVTADTEGGPSED